MAIFVIVLSSLALLAATAALVLIIREGKRSQNRNTALAIQLKGDIIAAAESTKKRFDSALEEQSGRIDKLSQSVDNLEKGIVPDFEKAKEAAKAVNDFNVGISGILGFDPHEVLRKQRSENFGGEDG